MTAGLRANDHEWSPSFPINSADLLITIALTGGVAAGKSSVMTLLRRQWSETGEFFSADEAVHELLTKAGIKSRVSEVFGSGILSTDGEIDRGKLREIVFRDESLRKQLEGILHPEVRTMGSDFETASREDRKQFLVSEIPLLYEIESDMARDCDLVVAASEEVQQKRLAEERGLEPAIIDKLIRAQMPLPEKMARADFVIWNDGGRAQLEEQVLLFVAWLDQTRSEDVKFSQTST